MNEAILQFWENRVAEAKRIFFSYSTYVVLFFTAVPEMWTVMPQEYKEAIYRVLPWVEGIEPAIWIAGFAISFWKTRNVAQGIDIAKA